MPQKDAEVAVLKSELQNLTSTVLDIKKYLVESLESRNVHHTEIVTRLTVIEQQQHNFNRYQDTCDRERKEINLALIAVRETQAVHRRVGSFFMALVTAAAGIIEAFRHNP